MRIIAGEFRGRTIDAPEGSGTRPTIDRVRESLFSIIYSRVEDFKDCNVLDAFAGSGALGLEALSRGAQSVTFYEKDPKAAKVVQRNIERFGLSPSRAILRKSDIFENPPLRPSRPFSLVFLDPPYATDPDKVFVLLEKLKKSGAFSNDVIICYENSHKTELAPYIAQYCDSWDALTTRKYGKIKVTLLALKD